MGISDQIQLVEREFVAGDTLIKALMIQEKLSEFHIASWFLRNIERLYTLQMVEFNRELRDFEIVEDCWAGDVFADIVISKATSPDWINLGGGYIGGWCASELKQFFLSVNLEYPEALIASLHKAESRSGVTVKEDSIIVSESKPPELWNVDPADYPPELDAANIAFRAITTGEGDQSATHRNRLIAFLEKHYPHFKAEQIQRIATVANPDKSTGRKKRNLE